MELQIRGEFFNILNHAQFNNPSGSYTAAAFGYVTTARDPRIGRSARRSSGKRSIAGK